MRASTPHQIPANPPKDNISPGSKPHEVCAYLAPGSVFPVLHPSLAILAGPSQIQTPHVERLFLSTLTIDAIALIAPQNFAAKDRDTRGADCLGHGAERKRCSPLTSAPPRTSDQSPILASHDKIQYRPTF